MELEEMKILWNQMSADMDKSKKLTDSLIIKMTHMNYRNKLSKIIISETIGSVVCIAGALFILINFQKLNPWYLLVCGIISVFILCLLPILSIKAIRDIRAINIVNNNYKQSLVQYSKGKMQFVFVQKLSLYLGSALIVAILPVMGMLIGNKDFFAGGNFWMWYAILWPFLFWFSKWVAKSYNKTTADAEDILRELEGEI